MGDLQGQNSPSNEELAQVAPSLAEEVKEEAQVKRIARIGELGVTINSETDDEVILTMFWGHLRISNVSLSKTKGVKLLEQEVADKVISTIIRTIYTELRSTTHGLSKPQFFDKDEERFMVQFESVLNHIVSWQHLCDKFTQAVNNEPADTTQHNRIFFCRMDKVAEPFGTLDQKFVVVPAYVPQGASVVEHLNKQIALVDKTGGYMITGVGFTPFDFSFELTTNQYGNFLEINE